MPYPAPLHANRARIAPAAATAPALNCSANISTGFVALISYSTRREARRTRARRTRGRMTPPNVWEETAIAAPNDGPGERFMAALSYGKYGNQPLLLLFENSRLIHENNQRLFAVCWRAVGKIEFVTVRGYGPPSECSLWSAAASSSRVCSRLGTSPIGDKLRTTSQPAITLFTWASRQVNAARYWVLTKAVSQLSVLQSMPTATIHRYHTRLNILGCFALLNAIRSGRKSSLPRRNRRSSNPQSPLQDT